MVWRARVCAATVIAGALLATSAPGSAGADSACTALRGNVESDGSCEFRASAQDYLAEFSFPNDYPDQQALSGYLIPLRDDFVTFAGEGPPHDSPYTLTVTPTTYRSGDAGTGTQSLVLTMSQDANPHPVTWYRSFNFDLARGKPITLQSLFAAGADPMDVVYPEVRRELEKRWSPEVFETMVGEVDNATFANFALTDVAVIFFIGQGQLLGHPDGPLEVSVPRTALGL